MVRASGYSVFWKKKLVVVAVFGGQASFCIHPVEPTPPPTN